jgi:hypothetical protein
LADFPPPTATFLVNFPRLLRQPGAGAHWFNEGKAHPVPDGGVEWVVPRCQ